MEPKHPYNLISSYKRETSCSCGISTITITDIVTSPEFQQHFKISIIDAIIGLNIENMLRKVNFDNNQPKDTDFPYEWDGFKYRCGVYYRIRDRKNGTTKKIIEFHFSNDGFLYQPLPNNDTSTKYPHKMSNWKELSKTQITIFTNLTKFVDQLVSRNVIKKEDLRVQVLFNYEQNRINFRIRNNANHDMIQIDFEPGYPIANLEKKKTRNDNILTFQDFSTDLFDTNQDANSVFYGNQK